MDEAAARIRNLDADTALKAAQLQMEQAKADEQTARIRNLDADTRLKLVQMRVEKIKVTISLLAAAGAAAGAAVGGLPKVISAVMKGH